MRFSLSEFKKKANFCRMNGILGLKLRGFEFSELVVQETRNESNLYGF